MSSKNVVKRKLFLLKKEVKTFNKITTFYITNAYINKLKLLSTMTNKLPSIYENDIFFVCVYEI